MLPPFEAFVRGRLCQGDPPTVLDQYSYALGALQAEASRRIVAILEQVGSLGQCGRCGAQVWWVEHHNGRNAPYTAEGLNHFAECSAMKGKQENG